ncbi:MAG: hypothetical protein R3301_17605, partial [Saprospiraceae bacterium]|nr:hypothetical protein [Saprospiraceae bacterium]
MTKHCQPVVTTHAIPMEAVMRPDGTIDLQSGVSGLIEPDGYEMHLREDGTPVFMPAEPSAVSAGDCWEQFGGTAGANQQISAVVVTPSGEMYVGGVFTTIGSIGANRIAKWDGSTWSPLGSGLNSPVFSIVLSPQGDLYVGGAFNTAGGITANKVAKWDGAAWSALGTGMNNGWVYDLALSDNGDVYAGGDFTSVGDSTINRLARWDGTTWSSVGGGLNLTATALAFDGNGDLYVGGAFTVAGTTPVNRIAKWDGSTWSAFGSGMNNFVYDIEIVSPNEIYATGEFTQAGGAIANRIAKWDGAVWTGLGTGLSSWGYSLARTSSGDIYVGGHFNTAGGMSAPRIAKWDGSAWSGVGGGADHDVMATVLDTAGTLYIGGRFAVVDGVVAARVAKWDGTWTSFAGPGLLNGLSDRVYGSAYAASGDLYVCGEFTAAGTLAASRIARWDGAAWHALGSGLNNQVWDVAVAPNGDVYAGGGFNIAGGVSANRIARWDGTTWHPLGSGISGSVYTIEIASNGHIYVGGGFSAAGGVAAANIAMWDGISWSALGAGVNSTVRDIEIDVNGDVYVGGNFTSAGGVSANRIAKWDGTAWSPLGSGVDNQVWALEITDSGDLYAGGSFSNAGGSPAVRIAKWDGASWSPLGSGLNTTVHSIEQANDGAIYVGGGFNIGGMHYIGKWDGTAWSALDNGTNQGVRTIAVTGDSALFAAGDFTFADDGISSYVARWTCICPQITLSTSVNSPLCPEDFAQFSVSVSGGSGGYSYLWSGPGILNGANTATPFIPSVSAGDAGVYTVVVTDADGCTASETVSLILDQTPPLITCPADLTFACLDATPPPHNTLMEFVAAGGSVSDDHWIDTSSFGFSESGGGDCPGQIVRSYWIMDACGNSASCSQILHVSDTIPPVIVCPPDLTVTCLEEVPPADTALVAATDNCSPDVPIAYMGDSISIGCPTVVQRFYMGVDACGNTTTCMQTIIVDDNLQPIIFCPPDLTVECLEDVPPADPNEVTAIENCASGVNVTLVTEYTSGACPVLLTRVWAAADFCGNMATCLQRITIEDTTAPVVTCPPDLTVECPGEVPPPDPGLVVATDNCSAGVLVTHSGELMIGSCPAMLVRTYTVADGCGLTTTCTQIIFIDDTTPPIPLADSLPDIIGDCSVTVDSIPLAEDQCAGLIAGETTSPLTYDSIGTYTIEWTFTDACGNTSTQAQQVIVGSVPPVAICHGLRGSNVGNGPDTLTPDRLDNGSYSPCGHPVELSIPPTVLTCADLDSNVFVTLTVTDLVTGQTATCVTEFNVFDPNSPVCNTNDITVALDATG